jgi:hypothetical protein
LQIINSKNVGIDSEIRQVAAVVRSEPVEGALGGGGQHEEARLIHRIVSGHA